jgi:hypothetical protein
MHLTKPRLVLFVAPGCRPWLSCLVVASGCRFDRKLTNEGKSYQAGHSPVEFQPVYEYPGAAL